MMKLSKFTILTIAFAAMGCSTTKKNSNREEKIIKKAYEMSRNKYDKWECSRLDEESEKLEKKIDKIKRNQEKFLVNGRTEGNNEGSLNSYSSRRSGLYKKREERVYVQLEAVNIAMDVCIESEKDEDSAPERSNATIHNENNININNH